MTPKKSDQLYWITTGLRRHDARLQPLADQPHPQKDMELLMVQAPDGLHVYTLGSILQWLQEYHDLVAALESALGN